jgi:hypothetical protein
MELLRYNSWERREQRAKPHLWFAWYPCWVYTSQGVDIAWVWLEWIERKRVSDGWLRTKIGVLES